MFKTSLSIAGLLLLTLVGGAAQAHETFAPILKKVTPAVVNISVTSTQVVGRNPLLEDPFFRRFFNVPEGGRPQTRRSQSVGSGVIIDAGEGYIVTNHHVVNGVDSILVTLQDRRQVEAKLIGSDAATDVALLQIDRRNLTDIPLGDSEDLEVGDPVAAIGNPFGLGQTVTSGIVSALGRSGLIPQGYEDFIQTDASINPGNSGGALIDAKGRLIGINTAILSPAGGNVGIGFAVPVNIMRGVVKQLIDYGEVERGQLGVIIQDVTPELAEALDLTSPEGALVSQVVEDSAAEDAGVEVGDVVVELNGAKISDGSDLRNRIGLMRVGDDLELTVIRDGRRLSLDTQVGKATSTSVRGGASSERLEGATFRNIDPSHPLHGSVRGVEVSAVEPGSAAARFGLRQGDIVLSVNRRSVSNVDEFSDVVNATARALALHIQRGTTKLFIVVQ